jgi:hypothetical protein
LLFNIEEFYVARFGNEVSEMTVHREKEEQGCHIEVGDGRE